MTTEISAPESKKPSINPFLRALLGLLMLLPACALCSTNLLGLTIGTFTSSQQSRPFSNDSEFVGPENFERLFDTRIFTSAVEFTSQLVLVRTLVAAIFPILLSIGVYQLGKRSRRGVRLLFTLPMAFFAPVLVAYFSQRMDWMWDRESTKTTVLLIEALTMLIVSCAAGLLAYSAILRRYEADEKGWRAALPSLIAIWLIGQFAVTAYALQAAPPLGFLFRSDAITFSQFVFETSRLFNVHVGFAASVLVFLPVAMLGMLAMLILVLFRLQLEHDPKSEDIARPGNRLFGILGWVVTAIGAFGVIFILFAPYLVSLLDVLLGKGESYARSDTFVSMWLNSILPPLLVILFVQLPVAYLGALAIGAVRPFGRWSEWLLLLFSPWLFVTSMPFALQRMLDLGDADALGTFSALLPSLLISVPMLVVLTIFFKGHEPKWRQARAEGTSVIRAFFTKLFLPSLPLAGFLAALAILVATQDLIHSLTVARDPEQFNAASAIFQFLAIGPLDSEKIIVIFGLPVFLIFSVIFLALRMFYLDKLSLGREPTVAKQETPG
ncbi:MAG: hypothetical protein MHPDNHAH_01337 [Anaerolineales bacterium]|nr:hypothetical protein [Anaerolineales bacterium]